ncbi:MAG: hypothetical protein WC428_05310, partial [Candidatus Paceibacterota bacterium]
MSKKIDEQFYFDPDFPKPGAMRVSILSHYGMLSKIANWRDSIWRRKKSQRKNGDFGYNATERKLTLKELKSLNWDFIYVLEEDKEYERKEFFEKYNKSKPILTGFFEGIKGIKRSKGNLKTIKEVRNFVYSHEGKIGYIYWDNGDSDFESYNVDRSEYPVTIIIRFDEGYLYSVFPHHQEAVV